MGLWCGLKCVWFDFDRLWLFVGVFVAGFARCVWICFLFGELVAYVLFGLLGGSG